ncbi:sensor histidine kinase [Amycolatopsis sp. NPDC059657]|uniref:sensor histidine kinase n=1 Tax=Amycolatopsis sp. NPDC059657 TaxID=3346899 RepID=UPI003670B473
MKTRMVSLRTRLTALYGGLFLLAGLILLALNYLLVERNLPMGRAVARQMMAPEGAVVTDRVQVDPESLRLINESIDNYRSSALSTLVVQSAVALVIVALLAALFGWLIAARALRPVHTVTATARELSAADLHQRINLDGPADELKELADTFDEMLERLAKSFDAQKRFVANASHELRTPLAIQRTLIEVAMAHPEVSPQVTALGTELLKAGKESERLIAGLLVLAHSERGLERREAIRFDEITRTVVGQSGGEAAERTVEIHTDLRPLTVTGDQVLLEVLVTNLVRNALAYNLPGGTVHIEVGDSHALRVRNTGAPVPPEAVAGLFEPFRRLSPDRTDDSPHAGLGLSIVRAIAEAHDGSVHAEPGRDGGLLVTVDLPGN